MIFFNTCKNNHVYAIIDHIKLLQVLPFFIPLGFGVYLASVSEHWAVFIRLESASVSFSFSSTSPVIWAWVVTEFSAMKPVREKSLWNREYKGLTNKSHNWQFILSIEHHIFSLTTTFYNVEIYSSYGMLIWKDTEIIQKSSKCYWTYLCVWSWWTTHSLSWGIWPCPLHWLPLHILCSPLDTQQCLLWQHRRSHQPNPTQCTWIKSFKKKITTLWYPIILIQVF